MGRSRSRSNERKKSKRDRSPVAPPPPARSGKWDEGFGGIYLPAAGQDGSGPNLALTLPTVGELCMRKLIVNNIPKSKSTKDVVDDFTSAILSATGHESAIGIYPVVNCQYLTAVGATRNAMIELRTPASANVALTVLNGKNGLKIKRPKDYPKDAPVEGIPEDQLRSLSLDDIGGPGEAGAAVSTAAPVSNMELVAVGDPQMRHPHLQDCRYTDCRATCYRSRLLGTCFRSSEGFDQWGSPRIPLRV